MKRLGLLGAVPFVGMLGGVFVANRTTPYVLGMPFLLFWVSLWVVLTSVTLAVIYRLDPRNKEVQRDGGSAVKEVEQ
ncbi:DUF3311 domain-containing protein [Streptomyces sp. NBC_01267]|uniref:DUF3311 domain-containing protein n=1 Tax=unclassified Streptomyces TaxID=2593676 RepID=UPI00225504B5|nr:MULTISPECIES: DUF3311 domain-containing protein [unclassified Streptomyces]MCX4548554.1 DUF3311 domain-containing protein [Streptomyces sp. NBC_01500]WSC20166.1 DUF3311 domain-containing protein [Streptomyces sp. NBC_01766]